MPAGDRLLWRLTRLQPSGTKTPSWTSRPGEDASRSQLLVKDKNC